MNTTVGFVLLGVLVSTMVLKRVIVGALESRRARRLLASREPWTEETFATTTYPKSPRKAEAARRVRGLLERHVKVPMDGLRITDRIAEDLYMDLLADPHFFFAIEEEFGFDTPVHEYEKIRALVERLRTVGDVIEYVENQQWTR